MNSRKAGPEVGTRLSPGMCHFHQGGREVHAGSWGEKGSVEFHVDKRMVREANSVEQRHACLPSVTYVHTVWGQRLPQATWYEQGRL